MISLWQTSTGCFIKNIVKLYVIRFCQKCKIFSTLPPKHCVSMQLNVKYFFSLPREEEEEWREGTKNTGGKVRMDDLLLSFLLSSSTSLPPHPPRHVMKPFCRAAMKTSPLKRDEGFGRSWTPQPSLTGLRFVIFNQKKAGGRLTDYLRQLLNSDPSQPNVLHTSEEENTAVAKDTSRSEREEAKKQILATSLRKT